MALTDEQAAELVKTQKENTKILQNVDTYVKLNTAKIEKHEQILLSSDKGNTGLVFKVDRLEQYGMISGAILLPVISGIVLAWILRRNGKKGEAHG